MCTIRKYSIRKYYQSLSLGDKSIGNFRFFQIVYSEHIVLLFGVPLFKV